MEFKRSRATGTRRAYVLEGIMLEACSCATICPCSLGEDPDNGLCDTIYGYSIDVGLINGVDVSGLNFVQVVEHTSNVRVPNSWRRVTCIDERATPEQRDALVAAWHGRLGGTLADLNQLVGEDLGVFQAPIELNLTEGDGSIAIPGKVRAAMYPLKSPYGTATTLRDSAFSTVPGAPFFLGKASHNIVQIPEYGMSWTFENRHAIQGKFRYEY
jgi:hypothetical protein